MQQALAITKHIGNIAGEADVLSAIGNIYQRLEHYNVALDYYQRSLALTRAIGSRSGEGNTLSNLGVVYNNLGNYSQALGLHQEALNISREIGDQILLARSLNNLGNLYTISQNPTLALDFLQQALAIFRDLGDLQGERVTLSNIGLLHQQQQQTELAIAFYKQSVNLTESIRQELKVLPREQQQSYTATVADTYRRLANLLLSQGRILEAQQVLELLKIQEICDFTRNPNTTGENSGVALNSTEEEILQQHGTLVAFGRKLKECQETNCEEKEQLIHQQTALTENYNEAIRTLEAEIRKRKGKDDDFLNPRHDFSRQAEEVIKAQPGTLLIYPLVLEDKLWLLMATEGEVLKKFEVEVTQQELSQAVLQLRHRLATPYYSIAQVQEASQKLYDWLIKPLESEIKAPNITNLVFALDRVTRYLPTSAL